MGWSVAYHKQSKLHKGNENSSGAVDPQVYTNLGTDAVYPADLEDEAMAG